MDLSVIHDRRGHAELEISFHRPQNMTTIHQATLGLNVCNSKKNYMGNTPAGVVSQICQSTNHRRIYNMYDVPFVWATLF